MSAEIEVAGQFGSKEASNAVLPVMSLMKAAAADVRIDGLDDRVSQLSLLLRISGQHQVFEGEPVENVKIAKDKSWISVDLLLSIADWQGRTLGEVAAVMADRLRGVSPVLAAVVGRRGVSLDADRISRGLESYANRFIEMARQG